MIKRIVLILMVLSISTAYSQSSKMFIPLDLKKAYDKETRSIDGKPGNKYWQNRSDYKISAELDPENLILAGTEEINYENNSPNKLTQLIIRLYPDIFRKDAMRNISITPDDLNDGVAITRLVINGTPVEVNQAKPLAARKYGTNLLVPLSTPLAAKSKCKIEISWNYSIPKKTKLRGGMYNPESFMISYWYPQIAVYDDVNGWDRKSYKGVLNFYNDYNNYDVKITVPENYIVWATGVLQNGNENFTEKTLAKIERAKTSEKIINILKKEDTEKGDVTKKNSKLTWHYKANNVNDFVFNAGRNMLWDASMLKLPNGKEVFVSSIYHRETKYCEEVAGYARKSIRYYSYIFPGIAYPYPSMTVFNHPGGGGMEYPMMVNDGISRVKEGAAGVTAHEIAHTYLPFYIGANEEKYAWMDEGWAVMLTYNALPYIIPGTKSRDRDGQTLSVIMGTEGELPQGINSDIVAGSEGNTYAVAAYPRAGIALELLKNEIGENLFKKAMIEFAERWKGKHPTQYDFYFTFNQATGQNLDWFWIPWFFEKGYADIAIKKVTESEGVYKIEISKIGIMPVPVILTFTYADGSKAVSNHPASVWKDGRKEYIVEIKTSNKIEKIELGSNSIPDVHKSNNKYLFTK